MKHIKNYLLNSFHAFLNYHPQKKNITWNNENQLCYDNQGNFLGWFSRSVTTTLVSFCKGENNEWYVLCSQRGKGTPDKEYHNWWNVCCGYLNWNEELKNCACRETYEETGVMINSWNINLFDVKDSLMDKRQNISFRYYTVLPNKPKYYMNNEFSKEHNEKDEVGEICFIRIDDLDNFNFAFDHKKLIKDIYNQKIKNL